MENQVHSGPHPPVSPNPSDQPSDLTSDTPQDAPQDTPQDTPQDAPQVAPQNTPASDAFLVNGPGDNGYETSFKDQIDRDTRAGLDDKNSTQAEFMRNDDMKNGALREDFAPSSDTDEGMTKNTPSMETVESTSDMDDSLEQAPQSSLDRDETVPESQTDFADGRRKRRYRKKNQNSDNEVTSDKNTLCGVQYDEIARMLDGVITNVIKQMCQAHTRCNEYVNHVMKDTIDEESINAVSFKNQKYLDEIKNDHKKKMTDFDEKLSILISKHEHVDKLNQVEIAELEKEIADIKQEKTQEETKYGFVEHVVKYLLGLTNNYILNLNSKLSAFQELEKEIYGYYAYMNRFQEREIEVMEYVNLIIKKFEDNEENKEFQENTAKQMDLLEQLLQNNNISQSEYDEQVNKIEYNQEEANKIQEERKILMREEYQKQYYADNPINPSNFGIGEDTIQKNINILLEEAKNLKEYVHKAVQRLKSVETNVLYDNTINLVSLLYDHLKGNSDININNMEPILYQAAENIAEYGLNASKDQIDQDGENHEGTPQNGTQNIKDDSEDNDGSIPKTKVRVDGINKKRRETKPKHPGKTNPMKPDQSNFHNLSANDDHIGGEPSEDRGEQNFSSNKSLPIDGQQNLPKTGEESKSSKCCLSDGFRDKATFVSLFGAFFILAFSVTLILNEIRKYKLSKKPVYEGVEEFE